MSDTRTTTLQIKAETSGFRNGLRTARKQLTDFNNEVSKSAKKREAINGLGNSLGKMGLLAAGGAAVAIRAFATFDQAMSGVKSTGADAAKNIDALTKAAMDAGQATQFSATEAAAAVENLAKAGVSSADILGGGLSGALSLAAAGMIPVADAAEYASIALTQFKLEGADVPHVADLLAAGAGKANGEVTDLAGALNQSGLVAAQMGLSIEETTGSLAAFASAGLLGSDAGTSLKTMLLRLQNPSKESAGLMDRLGISAYDAQGNFVGMADLAGQLQGAFKGQAQSTRDAAMAQIFGSDAIRAANVLYNQGATGISDWTTKVNDSGYAAETAATKMDNLKGDWEQLTGSLETALIGTGEGADGPLRGLLQSVTDLTNAFNDLPAPAKSGMLQIMALTAVVGLGGFAATRAITGYASLKTSINDLGLTAKGTEGKFIAMRGGAMMGGAALLSLHSQADNAVDGLGAVTDALGTAAIGFSIGGPWGAAVGGAVGIIKGFAGANNHAVADVDSLTESLDRQNGALTANTKQMVINALQKDGAYKKGKALGVDAGTVTDAALGDKAAIARIKALRAAAGDGKPKYGQTAEDLKAFNDLLAAVGAQTDAVEEAKRSWREEADAKAQSLELNKLSAAEVTGLTKSVKGLPKNVATQFTQPGFKGAEQNVVDIARKYKLTPDQVTTAMKALNYTKPQIAAVLKAMKTVDGTVAKPKVTINSDGFYAKVGALQSAINGMSGTTIPVGIRAPKDKPYTGMKLPAGYASGGIVPGKSPADPRVDNVPAMGASTGAPLMVRSGEWIINERQSQKNDRWLRAINNGLNMDAYMRGYAGGGKVGGGSPSTSSAGPETFRLVNPRVTLDNSGLRLIDDRIEKVNAGNENYRASKNRAGSKP